MNGFKEILSIQKISQIPVQTPLIPHINIL